MLTLRRKVIPWSYYSLDILSLLRFPPKMYTVALIQPGSSHTTDTNSFTFWKLLEKPPATIEVDRGKKHIAHRRNRIEPHDFTTMTIVILEVSPLASYRNLQIQHIFRQLVDRCPVYVDYVICRPSLPLKDKDAGCGKLGDGLFLNTCREVAKSYPEIEFDDMIVDNTCMQIVSNPWQFDVMLLPNLYGNIVGNIATGLVGGPGIVPGKNVGEDYAVFETATRNTGKNIAGKNMANPSAMFLASALMLDHIGLQQHAQVIRDATYKTISEKQIHTPDLGGLHTTRDVVQSVIDEIENTKHSVRL